MPKPTAHILSAAFFLAAATIALPVHAEGENDLPPWIQDEIRERITHRTTFAIFSASRAERWSPRSIELMTFVRSPSHDEADTALYAMIYKVTVVPESGDAEPATTTCQVAIVYRRKAFDEPLVICEPVSLGETDHQS